MRRCSMMSLLASMLLIAGCASTIEALLGIHPPTLYANWISRGVRWTAQSKSRVLRAAGGKDITVTTLSDGQEALEIQCKEVPLYPNVGLYVRPEEIKQRQLAAVQWERRRSRVECVEEAAKQCRLFLWNGKSTFALMYEYVYMRPDAESVISIRMYARCMTLDALKKWAISSSAPIDARAEELWDTLLDDPGESE